MSEASDGNHMQYMTKIALSSLAIPDDLVMEQETTSRKGENSMRSFQNMRTI